jgi:hypothetical protein
MARRGDGLYLRGQTWYLDCRINGGRHVVKLGKNIKATEAYLTWMTTNCRPRTQRVYQQQLDQLSLSFAGKLLSQISSFDIERHKHRRVEAGARVVAKT